MHSRSQMTKQNYELCIGGAKWLHNGKNITWGNLEKESDNIRAQDPKRSRKGIR